jgi:hypothetical protein
MHLAIRPLDGTSRRGCAAGGFGGDPVGAAAVAAVAGAAGATAAIGATATIGATAAMGATAAVVPGVRSTTDG